MGVPFEFTQIDETTNNRIRNYSLPIDNDETLANFKKIAATSLTLVILNQSILTDVEVTTNPIIESIKTSRNFVSKNKPENIGTKEYRDTSVMSSSMSPEKEGGDSMSDKITEKDLNHHKELTKRDIEIVKTDLIGEINTTEQSLLKAIQELRADISEDRESRTKWKIGLVISMILTAIGSVGIPLLIYFLG